jgi:hypothetical protein
VSRGPWRPPAWFEWPAQRIRFERELAACRAEPRRTRPERRHRGGYQLTVTVVPPGLAPRHVTIVFTPTAPVIPRVYADGPTDSPHRYDDGALCMWYPFDPAAARWTRPGGAAALLGQIVAHLVREEWWRRTGEWVGDEAGHGAGHDDDPPGSTPEMTSRPVARTVAGSPPSP